MNHYRWAATGEIPESMEVYPDEMPWTVQEIRRLYHRAELRAHCSATDSAYGPNVFKWVRALIT